MTCFKVFVALIALVNVVFSAEEKHVTFIKVINTNLNVPIVPQQVNTPEEITLDQIKAKKNRPVDVVLFDQDWELEWLMFLRDSIQLNQNITITTYMEKRTYLNMFRQ
jgi:hypothetical protein